MKVRISSDGTPRGTFIENSETGERLEGVTAITWKVSIKSFSEATVTLINIPIKIVGEAHINNKKRNIRMLRPIVD
jgi:hypothetical protein